jgi:hypothetical protein
MYCLCKTVLSIMLFFSACRLLNHSEFKILDLNICLILPPFHNVRSNNQQAVRVFPAKPVLKALVAALVELGRVACTLKNSSSSAN